ncbi:MAG: plasmid mobilization relaxosome protein MobC [Actinomycetota bacterium]
MLRILSSEEDDGHPDGAPWVREGRRRRYRGRHRRIQLKLHDDEYEVIARAAGYVGLTATGFAAEGSLQVAEATVAKHEGGEAPTGPDRALALPDEELLKESVVAMMAGTTELNRIGVNLNQIAARLNATGELPGSGQVEAALEALFAKIEVLEERTTEAAKQLRRSRGRR